MSSFMSTSSPTPVFGQSPLSIEDKKVIAYNNKKDKQHLKIMNESKPMTRRFNVNQFLTNMKKEKPTYFKMLSDAYPNLESVRDIKYFLQGYDDDDDETIILREPYVFDKQVQNKTALKIELIKFVIYLLYENYYTTSNELMNIFLIAQHLIKYSFTARFKILSKHNKNVSLTSINKLVCFLLNPDKNSDIIFNEDIIIEEEEEDIIIDESQRNCCCCFDTYQKNLNYIQCSCSVEICLNCFLNLTPRRCPQCRNEDIKMICTGDIINEKKDKRKFQFTSLSKVKAETEINLKHYCHDVNEFLLMWQEEKQIRYTELKIQSMSEIIKDEYDNLIDDLENYRIPNEEILYYLDCEVNSDFNGIISHGMINYMREEEPDDAGKNLKKILKINNINDYKSFRRYRNFEYEKEDSVRRELYRTYNDDENERYFFTMLDDKTSYEKYETYEIDSDDEEIEHKIFNLNTNTYGANINITRFNYGDEVII